MAARPSFSNDSSPCVSFVCLRIRPYSIIIPTITAIIILSLLPLYIFILRHGLQQWRKTSSSSSSSSMSHSDCLTYHMVLMELINIVGHILFHYGIFSLNEGVLIFGFNVMRFIWMGKMLLHLLTSVERYLAVVHPITYMRLRNREGIRIRNVSIVCVWIISGAYFFCPTNLDFYVPVSTIPPIAFFSLSVLLVLVRPGPGEQGGRRQWADPSKKRAFFTIVAILGVLVLNYFSDIVWLLAQSVCVPLLCLLVSFLAWVEVANSLVLPLLFLLRHGRRSTKQ